MTYCLWWLIYSNMGKHQYIFLDEEERILLTELIRANETSARVQTRARVLLLSDRSQGQKRTLTQIGDGVICSMTTVRNIKRNYLSGGLEAALYEKPRPGAEPTFTGDIEAQLVMLACSDPPTGHARWSLRLLADRLIELDVVETISHVTVGSLLKKTNCNLGE
ncbi:helix-turn-helix domain-containing protein [Moorena sp. SIO4A1]|uniref:helix-turn-helix domain-containing protein n=1 Tax=Moorena sp. SIO4A1 TaxID=2607835 RepID=UPI0025FDFBD2|nr:helix-turn-helix domain-containing protein [Moorena sp. SIO4A1]